MTRRGSRLATLGGGVWLPDKLPNLLLWVRADRIGGLADGDDLTSWPNDGSEGAATDGGSAPKYETNEQNGLPGVDFTNANGDEMNVTYTTHLTDFSCFGVVNCDDFGAFGGVVCKALDFADRNMYFIIRSSTGKVTIGFTSAASTYEELSSGGELTAGTTSLVEGKFSDADDEFTIGLDGTIETGSETTIPEDTSNGGDLQIGHDFGSENLDGFIYEALCYNRALSTVESTKVRDYLNKKWAVY